MSGLLDAPRAGWLVPDAARVPTYNCYCPTYRADLIQPVDALLFHWTATPATVQGTSNRARIERWLAWVGQGHSRTPSSTHFVVLRDGVVLQGAPLTDRTWHAGIAEWRGRRSLNRWTIGVDLDCVGPLRLIDDRYVDTYGGEHHGEVDHDPDGRAYEPYYSAQIDAVCELVARLIRVWPHLADDPAASLVGHSQVSPGRKQDPGPLFPWGEVVDAARHALDGASCG